MSAAVFAPELRGAVTALLDQAATAPEAPLLAAIGAPGGYGKTTVLQELARAYGRSGVPVDSLWQQSDGPGRRILLADDAHLLGEDRLAELRAEAELPGARMVVAYRPWPRPAGLVRLVDVLRRERPPVTLAPLGAEEIRLRLVTALGESPAALTGYVAACAGGVPRYVSRLVAALTTTEVPARVPVAALAPFAAELDDLDADLRTLLLAVEAGAGLSFDLIAALLDRDAGTVAGLAKAGQATGLLGAGGRLVPLARQALAALGPIAQRIDVRQRLAALQMARGAPVLPLMRPLLPDALPHPPPSPATTGPDATTDLSPGTAGAGLGQAFETAGEEAIRDDPALAARLFAAAADAGRPTAARLAHATALAGDLDQAARLADQALASGTAEQRAGAAYVAAVMLAHRSQLDRSVDLLGWAEPGPAAGFRAVGLIGTGRPANAAADDPATGDGPPTLLRAAAALMARGVRESIGDTPATALSTLIQAAAVLDPAGATVLLPDSPAALAALVALHCSELDTCDMVLDQALRSGTGGPLQASRHRLLRAWSALLRGHLAGAEQLIAAATGVAVLHGRDLLFVAALRAGLARRAGDPVALRAIWPDACQILIGQPVDLFTLLPLGELAVAAARLGEHRRVATPLAEADRLLGRLGDPPLWSAPLHWSRLHAAILAGEPESAGRWAAGLDGLAGSGPCPAALAAAAHSWLDVLADRIDPDGVQAAARGLAELGLAWDGARLAGQAAIRTPDRRAMTALLECARALQGRPAGPEPQALAGGVPDAAEPLLSEREQQVAALVLTGLTYKQVADRLYISAKTVEHHMARIRQRLGCTDRRELLTRLRELTAGGTAVAPDGGPA